MSKPSPKKELISKVYHARILYLAGFVATALFLHKDTVKVIKTIKIKAGDISLNLDHLIEHLEDSSTISSFNLEFMKIFSRTISRDMYEIVKEYCQTTNQMKLFKNQPWYTFSRLIRNAMAHNQSFVFTEYDKKLLPVTWNDVTITKEMEGKYVFHEDFNYWDTWNLLNDYSVFVSNQLE